MPEESNSRSFPSNESDDQISDLLPLKLIKSEIIPPSPNRSQSTIDWLPEFAGFSWIAYGASSLLVISHFPSPLSEDETLIGPIFRQVIELSSDESTVVKAVAWSPSVPSDGEIAVALGNCVCLFSESSGRTEGGLCWSQISVLAHSFKVEAVKWTGSGDGIVAAGINVVLWKRKSTEWEIAWKFTVEQPQTLVSATWSTEGPVASVAYSNKFASVRNSEASRCVLVYHNDSKSGVVKSELRHPQPVSMIQWRPLSGTHSQREVLMTCCMDGTVRLWSEIDSGRARRFVKDIHDQKNTRGSFHVIAIIEINQTLNGILGIDTFVTWAVESRGMMSTNGDEQCFPRDASEGDNSIKCEWLMGYGPGTLISFWAIHCLDDISPSRFPRVTLWKKQDLKGSEVSSLQGSKDQSVFIKAVISRSQLIGPPNVCSLFELSFDNAIRWLRLNTSLSNIKFGSISTTGHTGSILQVAVHPCSSEVEIAVSLDSNGLLLFWSLSTVSDSILGTSALGCPAWKLLRKSISQDLLLPRYSSLGWVSSALNEECILLMGHAGGIDCYTVTISKGEEERALYHKLCTIPFIGHVHEDGPANIFAMPLPSTCDKSLVSDNKIMLLAVWLNDFKALSWTVAMHCDDLAGSSDGCDFDAGNVTNHGTWTYTNIFAGKRYHIVAHPCSSVMPDPHAQDQVTSFAVVCPGNLMTSGRQKWASDGLCRNTAAYHMATGCSDGSLKLWRCITENSLTPAPQNTDIPWELVGAFYAHQGPVRAMTLSSFGQKIATTTLEYHPHNRSTLRIWEAVHVIGAGNVLLEDNISLDGTVIAVHWLTIGNGQLLLGVCMENELRIYAQRRSSCQTTGRSREAVEMNIWICIALGCTSPATKDFLWGPRGTPVLVHDSYFCLFSKWSFCMGNKHQTKCYPSGTAKPICSAIYADCDLPHKVLSMDKESEEFELVLPTEIIREIDFQIYNLFSAMYQCQNDPGSKFAFWNILNVSEKLCTSLPIYHPEALLFNLYSGSWKRACVAVRHLVEYLKSDVSSPTCEKGRKSLRPSDTIPQIPLSKYCEESLSTSISDKGVQWGADSTFLTSDTQFQASSFQNTVYNLETNGSSNMFTSTSGQSEISGFIETLEKFHDIAGITSIERIQMLSILELLGEVSSSHCSSAYESLDGPARRFWVGVKFEEKFLRRCGSLETVENLVVDSGLIGWAFHSDCQENLLNSVLSSEPSWQELRKLGVGFWFTDATQLRTRMEKVARLQYLKKRDPKDCALLYIALNRLQVLAGLFKVSRDEKDKPLVGFLSRNFKEEKNKAAALKNAYVLMGRHQLELAVAFFLLGGDASSAVSVCAKNLGDEQLALVICRLVEGYGGSLEHILISKILLPTANEKGDYWLASFFEWVLGNYSQSFLKFLGIQIDSLIDKSVFPSNGAAFLDPRVGQYCLMLATKNTMKNSVGECAATMLARWATVMTSTALNRCGFPLEALECLSSSLGLIEGSKNDSSKQHGILFGILKAPVDTASNWLSADVALSLESSFKLDLAAQYISKLLMEHPSWENTNVANIEQDTYEPSLKKFQHKLYEGLSNFEQKHSLRSIDLINMILVFLSNNGMLLIGHHIVHCFTSGVSEQDLDKNDVHDSFLLCPAHQQLFLKETEEVLQFFARYIVVCSSSFSSPNPSSLKPDKFGDNSSGKVHSWDVYMQGLVNSIKSLRTNLKFYSSSCLTEDLVTKAIAALDLLEYYVHFASVWLHRNLKDLILMVHPIWIACSDGHTPSEIDITTLKKIIYQRSEVMSHDLVTDGVRGLSVSEGKQLKHDQDKRAMSSIAEDERWKLIGAYLWKLQSKFTKDQLNSGSDSPQDGYPAGCLPSKLCFETSSNESSESDGSTTVKQIKLVPSFMARLLQSSLACASESHAKQLAALIKQKVQRGSPVHTLAWLEESNQSQPRVLCNRLLQGADSLKLINSEGTGASLFDLLWEISANPKEISEGFGEEKISWLQSISQKPSACWSDMHKSSACENGNGEVLVCSGEAVVSSSSANGTVGSVSGRQSLENHSVLGSRHTHSTRIKDVISFLNPEEIYKKNGELLEAMCINSIDQQQAAVASNKKGIIFINWKPETFRDQFDYIWSEADWPKNGWAGTESTPVPTFVSPGIGLGSQKGAHLGLGGATVGRGSLTRSGRDLTGGGAFGLPGYLGVGASGLGWGTQEEFEEFVDPPATINNISTKAMSSHPSRPFFLVGSSNTHVYLWEFGKARATATYGVLPAANVPPPYALASISALQFGHYGHRFVTAALDGTICTWQLEVGGRSNICPTESSLCFNNHASDVTYMAASGSVIAAAGYSSNGVNVVIWDTLAPPSTSQASLMCHEGGARSISVFDNDIGSGSVSPIIVTGGKGGDIGLHDFRFIATGKTKRHRHSNAIEQNTYNKSGEQNGMLWYMPKAHLGSVTRISTIPNTSLFLTGSKDGDVKLWDAKRSELVYHWPKLHERRTFLQPSSRGFGGVVQAAVTDIQVLSDGFLTCGGDGIVKQVQLKDFQTRT